MSHEAVIKFAPVFTLERFNDPKWRPDRRMYEPGALKFLPGTDTVPLIVDHDDDREIGTVQKLHKWDWPGGPWIFASATVTAPPPWLKRGTRVSFGSKVIDRRDISIREYDADVVALAFVEEVSVLSPSVQPMEPCAEVLSFRAIESPAAVPSSSDRGGAGEPYDERPTIYDEVERVVGYRVTDENFDQALAEAKGHGRSALDRLYGEHMAAKRQREPQVLYRPGIGQVLAVGGVPVR